MSTKKKRAALPETFTQYLRRVGRDYQASYMPGDEGPGVEESPTARDYADAANTIDELIAALEAMVDQMPRIAGVMGPAEAAARAAVKKAKTTP